MHPQLTIALRAAREAGTQLVRAFDRRDRIKIIRNEGDALLTSLDQEVDEAIVAALRQTYPRHGILSRVSGEHAGEDKDSLWLIDPLVGNRNFMAGYPVFAVSIAFKSEGITQQGLLFNPINQDEFLASRGKGAQLNGKRIRAAQDGQVDWAMLGLNARGLDVETFSSFQSALLKADAETRSQGCSPLDMALTACGQFQGGWCAGLSEVELAAPRLILSEAGGYLSDAAGSPRTEGATELLFGSSRMFRELVKLRARIKT